MVTHRVSIPMDGDMESLNAGVAATILMYEARRQVSGRADIV
jgi:tRNA G18 (ribose-2'-O)-methylase SpoU